MGQEKRVSRRREKKGRLRRDGAPGSALLSFGNFKKVKDDFAQSTQRTQRKQKPGVDSPKPLFSL